MLSMSSCAGFRSYETIRGRLDELAAGRPDLARVVLIGESVEGRPIPGLVVSRNPATEEDEPEVRVVAALHGNECLAAEMALRLAELLVEDYDTDPGIRAIVDRTELWIFPLANPDGYAAIPATRQNARRVDLNRNFGLMWVGSASAQSGDDPFSEPETQAFRENGLARRFVLGLSYHTVAAYVNAVWNYTPVLPRDSAEIEAIGLDYAGSSTYEFVFGWTWYAIYGDITDWAYGTSGTLDYTIECRSDADVEGEWAFHEQAMRAFLAWANRGARGLVTDRLTGKPLSARVTVQGTGEPVFTDPEVGDFHKVLLPGTYAVRVEANGYIPQVLTGVRVGEGDAIRIDVALDRDPGKASYAFQVMLTTIPQAIPSADYANTSVPSDALGPPDGEGYSLSPQGQIMLDLGATSPVYDREGPDLEVRSSTGSADPCDAYLYVEGDGWKKAASGSGDFTVDLAAVGLSSARYVLLGDQGSGPMDDPEPGYDLDAVVNLHPLPAPDIDGGVPDAGFDGGVPDAALPDAALPDAGRPHPGRDAGPSKHADGGHAGPDAGSDSGASEYRAVSGGCSCSFVGAGR